MSKLGSMHATIVNLTDQVEQELRRERNGDFLVSLSETCRNMAHAYHAMREIEIHEEFHSEEGGFRIPGEGPIEKGQN